MARKPKEKRRKVERHNPDLIDAYASSVAKYNLLTREEEVELGERIIKGDQEAIDKLVLSNLRLVMHIGRTYQGFGAYADIISEGNMGLVDAAKRFQPRYGVKFSTYAAWWIKQRIHRHLLEVRGPFRVPCHAWEKMCKIEKFRQKFEDEYGRSPTKNEIAKGTKIPENHLHRYLQLIAPTISLDATLSESSDASYGDVVEDELAVSPQIAAAEEEDSLLAKKLLKQLNPRLREIIERRYGINGYTKQTLEEIGQVFGVTRERIRQIENIALKILRRHVNKTSLSEEKAAKIEKLLYNDPRFS